jgi:4-amino-4-deoxy-L-arabinose transferase-like glycosyltransferase
MKKVHMNKSLRILLVILLLALLSRIVTAVWLGDEMEVLPAGGTHDQVTYDMLAHRVAEGYGFTFPTYWYPWVKPDTETAYFSGTMVLHLALIYKIFGYHPLIARILYAFLGTAVCYFLYKIGQQLFDERTGLIAAALAAGYAYLILYSAALLTEMPFIFFLLLALHLALKLDAQSRILEWVVYGLALSGLLLFRMAVMPFVVFILIYTAFKLHTGLQKLYKLAIPVIVIVTSILPWTYRNYRLFNRFMLLESQFGHVFWNGNHPDRDLEFEVSWVAPIPEDLRQLNEADLTYALLHRGISNVLSNPGRFIVLTLNRIKVFFQFWPSSNSSTISNFARVMSFGICLPFMIYGLVLSLKKWQKYILLYAFVVIHCSIYIVSWVMIRYRSPADTVLLLFAAYGINDIYSRLTKYWQNQSK